MPRTKKNILKFNDNFYVFLQSNMTLEQLDSFSLENTVSLLIAASDPAIKKLKVKRFLYNFGIRKIIKIQNSLLQNNPEYCWKVEDQDWSVADYIQNKIPTEPVKCFDKLDYSWLNENKNDDSSNFIDLTNEVISEDMLKDLEEDNLDQLDSSNNEAFDFLNQVNNFGLDNQEEIKKNTKFFGGNIENLPNELHFVLKKELIADNQSELIKIKFPSKEMTFAEAKNYIQPNILEKSDFHYLYELLKILPKFILKESQKNLLLKIMNSPEIKTLELQKKFGLLTLSHLKIIQKSIEAPIKITNTEQTQKIIEKTDICKQE